MNPSIIVPYNGEPSRCYAALFVLRFYCEMYPHLEVILGTTDSEPFSKSRACNNAAAVATGDPLVFVDADIIIVPEDLERGLSAGDWVIPYNRCLNMSPEDSLEIMSLEPSEVRWADYHPRKIRDKWKYAGGINIVSREVWSKVKGFDPRYRGWGGEDESFCRACNTLHAPAVIVPGDAYHLHHPKDPTADKFTRRGGGYQTYRSYVACTGKPDRMRKLIEEWTGKASPPESLTIRIQEGAR